MHSPSRHMLSISALALVVAGGLTAPVGAQSSGEGDINSILQSGDGAPATPAVPADTATPDTGADTVTPPEAPATDTATDTQPETPAPDAGTDTAADTAATPATDYGDVPFGLADADRPSLVPGIRVDQDDIGAGYVSFREMMEIGRHLFTQRFTAKDGYGEGPYGPREVKRQEEGTHGPMAAFAKLPWMRVNGLDSQSCLECHSVAGMDADAYAARPEARTTRTDGLSGAGTVATSAIINPMRQTPAPDWVRNSLVANGYQDPDAMLAVFLRNPPHIFGAGYTQSVSEEMSFDLIDARYRTLEAAAADPGVVYEIGLEAKGTDFGVYSAAVRPGSGEIFFDQLGPCGTNPQLDEYCGQIDGVGGDFIVRPFQWKGIASSMRNFVRDALNFHFAMTPDELSPGTADLDGDGVEHEVSVGEVTALTAFALSTRPPVQATPENETDYAAIERGRWLFNGEGMPAGYDAADSCSSCHHPSKELYDPTAYVHDPRTVEAERIASAEATGGRPALIVEGTGVGLGLATPAGLTLPVEARFAAGGDLPAKERAEASPEAKENFGLPGFGLAYAFDLSFATPNEDDPFPASLPRLEVTDAATVDVPLFSDLKRHKMGRCLADIIEQQTDREGVFVPRDEFLTRPLWGVGDTGPWLHDGRALSLRDAVMMHSDNACADDGSGFESAANRAVAAFEAMSADDQEALLTFLRSLRLPKEYGH